MSQHTPGPWHLVKEEEPEIVTGGILRYSIRSANADAFKFWGHMADYRGPIVAYAAENEVLRRDGTITEKVRADANAAVLAAAPDLLAACIEALDELRNVGTAYNVKTRQRLHAAIAKATGS